MNTRIADRARQDSLKTPEKLNEYTLDDKIEDLQIVNLPPEPKLPNLPPEPEQSTELLTGEDLQKEKQKQEEDTIKQTLKLVRDELEGLKDSRKEDDQKLITDIIDPSNGNITDSKLSSADIDKSNNEKTTDKSITLPNSNQPSLEPEELFIPVPTKITDNIHSDTSVQIDPEIEHALNDMLTDDYKSK